MSSAPLDIQVKTKIETVPTALAESENAILLRLMPRRGVTFKDTPTSIGLVLDNSGSMLPDPQRRVVETLAQLTPRFRDADLVAGVAFGDHANVFHDLSNDHGSFSVWGDLRHYGRNCGAGGTTNMAEAIELGTQEILKGGDTRAMRMLLLTDGHPDDRPSTIRAAQRAVEQGINITTLGYGAHYDFDFLEQIAALSNDTAWDMRDESTVTGDVIDRVLAAQDELATNVVLEMAFLGKHRILDSYTVHPFTRYNGPVKLKTDRLWRQPLQPVEREKGLEVLVNVAHPKLTPGRKTVARITLRYDVPALGLKGQETSEEVTVVASDAIQHITEMDPEVEARVQEAFEERQRLRADQAMKAGHADRALRLLGTIKKTTKNANLRQQVSGTMKMIRKDGKYDEGARRALASGTRKKR
jgi:hypothetical protein